MIGLWGKRVRVAVSNPTLHSRGKSNPCIGWGRGKGRALPGLAGPLNLDEGVSLKGSSAALHQPYFCHCLAHSSITQIDVLKPTTLLPFSRLNPLVAEDGYRIPAVLSEHVVFPQMRSFDDYAYT